MFLPGCRWVSFASCQSVDQSCPASSEHEGFLKHFIISPLNGRNVCDTNVAICYPRSTIAQLPQMHSMHVSGKHRLKEHFLGAYRGAMAAVVQAQFSASKASAGGRPGALSLADNEEIFHSLCSEGWPHIYCTYIPGPYGCANCSGTKDCGKLICYVRHPHVHISLYRIPKSFWAPDCIVCSGAVLTGA